MALVPPLLKRCVYTKHLQYDSIANHEQGPWALVEVKVTFPLRSFKTRLSDDHRGSSVHRHSLKTGHAYGSARNMLMWKWKGHRKKNSLKRAEGIKQKRTGKWPNLLPVYTIEPWLQLKKYLHWLLTTPDPIITAGDFCSSLPSQTPGKERSASTRPMSSGIYHKRTGRHSFIITLVQSGGGLCGPVMKKMGRREVILGTSLIGKA